MKPLQTHGLFDEVWSPPPPERFVTYDRGDEKWMRPLGLGMVRKVPLPMYDVRIADLSLVGYVEFEPTLQRWPIELPYREPQPICLRSFGKPISPFDRPSFDTIRMESKIVGIHGERFVCWVVTPEDGARMIECGLVRLVGKDRLREVEYELRRKQFERDSASRFRDGDGERMLGELLRAATSGGGF